MSMPRAKGQVFGGLLSAVADVRLEDVLRADRLRTCAFATRSEE